jgi:site-specific DNA-cytosine methylase
MTTITHSRYWQPTGELHTLECGCVVAQYVETGTHELHEAWESIHPCPTGRGGRHEFDVDGFVCRCWWVEYGAVTVPGVTVRLAANHWKLACEVHNANHPTTDHAHVDLHQEDPAYFPSTDLLWASPECTKWSQAAGGRPLPAIEEGLFEDPLSDDAASRSRLLMFDVLRFADYHRYRAMIVENVVDIATQAKYRLAWRSWRDELVKLGYQFKVVSLNSMHAQALGPPAPQSRDRLYIVCWRNGDRPRTSSDPTMTVLMAR